MYKDFKFNHSAILPEVLIIEPDCFSDQRGTLYTDYLKEFFNKEINQDLSFDHSKYAYNKKDVLRGIHGDFDSWKLVNCVFGDIFQVVVDCRENSETFLTHQTFNLSHTNPKLILIPPGFGNAFLALTDDVVYNYKLSYNGSYNDYDKQFTFKWNDENIGIDWPISNPILSDRDK
jgi:dTDP-4-dehydrorhamnose 3,5-epimerase